MILGKTGALIRKLFFCNLFEISENLIQVNRSFIEDLCLVYFCLLVSMVEPPPENTEPWGDFNSKETLQKKILQNPFLGCQWSVLEGKTNICTVESIYFMI